MIRPTFVLYNLHHDIFIIHNNIVAERRMPIPVILIAIADCKRRKGAIACVCFVLVLEIFDPILMYLYLCTGTRISNFSASGMNQSVLISPEGDDGRNGVSRLFSSVRPYSFGRSPHLLWRRGWL
jgi:hypothetical protein